LKKVNLLYVITKLELGGAQKQLLHLLKSLDTGAYSVFLFTGVEGDLNGDFDSIEGLTIKRCRFLVRSVHPLKDLFSLIALYRFMKLHCIDIVHTHSSKAGILGRLAAGLARIQHVLHTVHGWSFNDHQSFAFRRLFIWLERFTAQFTDAILVVSSFDKQKGLAHRIGREENYCFMRYGVEYSNPAAGDYRLSEALGIRDEHIVVAMIGCFKIQKAPLDFIRMACLVLNDTHNRQVAARLRFLLIGDGILRQKIEQSIRAHNLQEKVVLAGWRRDIPGLLARTDIFALTSLWEGMPISVLEAMSLSLPVVATNTGGIAEVIREGRTGFLVAPQDSSSMAQKISILLHDISLRRTIGRNARESLGNDFSIDAMVACNLRQYERLYSRKVDGPG
jgi:glycosyltransferase involved in cell wall biosynthesis